MSEFTSRNDARHRAEGAWNSGNFSGSWMQSLDDYVALEFCAALPDTDNGRSPRQTAIAALQAVSRLLEFIAAESDISRSTARLVIAMDANLKNLKAELEGLEQHKPCGPITSTLRQRKSENNRALAQYARMVVAVRWLQMLRESPLRPGQAMRAVARAMYGSESEIDILIARFERPNSRRRQDIIYRMWHELEESYRQSGRSLADASLETIFLWAKGESPHGETL
jgi:hypothetical protein